MTVESISRTSSSVASHSSVTSLASSTPKTALETLIEAARSASPVQAGEAMRALDLMVVRSYADQLAQNPDLAVTAQPAVLTSDQPVAQIIQVQDARTAGRINLLDHEGRGVPPSHTFSLHVGKSRQFLMNMMQPISNGMFSIYKARHSTFTSLESANALVSSTLATGAEVSPGLFYKEFSSPTGTAAVRRDMIPIVRPQGRVNFETAYGVLVVTRPDTGMPGGFRVQTAYPTIPFSGRGQ